MENGIGTEADDIMREPRLPFDVLVGILRLKLQGNGLARDVFDKYVHGSWKISLCAAKLCAKYIITRRTPNTFQNSRSQPPLSR